MADSSRPKAEDTTNVCHICGKPIEDGQLWTVTGGSDEIAHEVCADLEGQ